MKQTKIVTCYTIDCITKHSLIIIINKIKYAILDSFKFVYFSLLCAYTYIIPCLPVKT